MTARLLAALALWVAAAPTLAAGAATGPATLDPAALAAVSPPPAARAPMEAAFVDQHDRAVTLGALAQGRPLVLVPVQHACRSLCGLTLASLAAAVRRQGLRPGSDFTLVAFGIDPRETPAAAAQSAARLGGADAPGVEALVGRAPQIAAVTGALGYRYTWWPATGQYAHMAAIAVLAPDGRLVRWMQGLGVQPGALDAALADARRGRTDDAGDVIRLLCFHFDPTTGRYTLAIFRLTQVLAGGFAACLAAGVGLAFWRERRRGSLGGGSGGAAA